MSTHPVLPTLPGCIPKTNMGVGILILISVGGRGGGGYLNKYNYNNGDLWNINT